MGSGVEAIDSAGIWAWFSNSTFWADNHYATHTLESSISAPKIGIPDYNYLTNALFSIKRRIREMQDYNFNKNNSRPWQELFNVSS